MFPCFFLKRDRLARPGNGTKTSRSIGRGASNGRVRSTTDVLCGLASKMFFAFFLQLAFRSDLDKVIGTETLPSDGS
jgi:hypothetical protein